MPNPASKMGPVNVRVSGRTSLIDRIQEITLRAVLNRAID